MVSGADQCQTDENYPDDAEMKVSHETLGQTLYLQAKGELHTELKLTLRQGRAKRVPRSRASLSRGEIPDMDNIRKRPAGPKTGSTPLSVVADL
jgi:IS30 family transposase